VGYSETTSEMENILSGSRVKTTSSNDYANLNWTPEGGPNLQMSYQSARTASRLGRTEIRGTTELLSTTLEHEVGPFNVRLSDSRQSSKTGGRVARTSSRYVADRAEVQWDQDLRPGLHLSSNWSRMTTSQSGLGRFQREFDYEQAELQLRALVQPALTVSSSFSATETRDRTDPASSLRWERASLDATYVPSPDFAVHTTVSQDRQGSGRFGTQRNDQWSLNTNWLLSGETSLYGTITRTQQSGGLSPWGSRVTESTSLRLATVLGDEAQVATDWTGYVSRGENQETEAESLRTEVEAGLGQGLHATGAFSSSRFRGHISGLPLSNRNRTANLTLAWQMTPRTTLYYTLADSQQRAATSTVQSVSSALNLTFEPDERTSVLLQYASDTNRGWLASNRRASALSREQLSVRWLYTLDSRSDLSLEYQRLQDTLGDLARSENFEATFRTRF
jgi:hypothetical protein